MTGTVQALEFEVGVASNGWKPYPAYKDSGVDWLGRVPEHWELNPAFGAYQPVCERNRGMKEKTVLSLSYGRIVVRPPEKLYGLVPESFETYQIAEPGDIILRTTDLQNDHTSLRVGRVRQKGIITSAYLNLRVKAGMGSKYGYQFLNVWDLTKSIYGFGSGLRQNLDFVHFKRMPVLLPPPAEQAAIVQFLDYHDRLIRKSIRAKQKLIGLLTEQKQAIIQHSVTRGLNPDVKLKPSGVDWLGELPEHWESKPAHALFSEVKDCGHPHEQMLSVTIKKGVIPQTELLEDSVKKDSSRDEKSAYKLVCAGDIAYNKMRAWQGAFGVSDYRGIISPAYIVMRPKRDVDGKYYHYLLRTPRFAKEAERWSYGIVSDMWSLRPEHFRMIYLPMPGAEEQREISRHIERAVLDFDSAIGHAEREIALMREYRTRLTADVVTGKIDVRETAAALPVDLADLVGDDDALTETVDDDGEGISNA